MVSETGSWAWLRLLRGGRLHRHRAARALHACGLGAQGHYADFELRAASVDNPFDLQMFARFACPTQI